MDLKKIKLKEVLKFLVGGGSAVITDFLLYMLLRDMLGVNTAKAISFISGSIVGFVINKLWTFESKSFSGGEILRYTILYACSAAVNTVINKGVLVVLSSTALAFLAATGVSTIINFLGQKFFVFQWKK